MAWKIVNVDICSKETRTVSCQLYNDFYSGTDVIDISAAKLSMLLNLMSDLGAEISITEYKVSQLLQAGF